MCPDQKPAKKISKNLLAQNEAATLRTKRAERERERERESERAKRAWSREGRVPGEVGGKSFIRRIAPG